jgi:hypothetical protein
MGSENTASYELHLNHMVNGIPCDIYRKFIYGYLHVAISEMCLENVTLAFKINLAGS